MPWNKIRSINIKQTFNLPILKTLSSIPIAFGIVEFCLPLTVPTRLWPVHKSTRKDLFWNRRESRRFKLMSPNLKNFKLTNRNFHPFIMELWFPLSSHSFGGDKSSRRVCRPEIVPKNHHNPGPAESCMGNSVFTQQLHHFINFRNQLMKMFCPHDMAISYMNCHDFPSKCILQKWKNII